MPIWPPEPQEHYFKENLSLFYDLNQYRHLYGEYTSVVITSTNAYIVLKPGPWVLNNSFIKEIFVTDKDMYGGNVAYIPVYVTIKFGLNRLKIS